jgi:hypothetical protein
LNADFLAVDAPELYRHPNEPIFLFLLVGSKRILVHNGDRSFSGAASPCKIWEHFVNSSNEVRLPLAQIQPGSCSS